VPNFLAAFFGAKMVNAHWPPEHFAGFGYFDSVGN